MKTRNLTFFLRLFVSIIGPQQAGGSYAQVSRAPLHPRCSRNGAKTTRRRERQGEQGRAGNQEARERVSAANSRPKKAKVRSVQAGPRMGALTPSRGRAASASASASAGQFSAKVELSSRCTRALAVPTSFTRARYSRQIVPATKHKTQLARPSPSHHPPPPPLPSQPTVAPPAPRQGPASSSVANPPVALST